MIRKQCCCDSWQAFYSYFIFLMCVRPFNGIITSMRRFVFFFFFPFFHRPFNAIDRATGLTARAYITLHTDSTKNKYTKNKNNKTQRITQREPLRLCTLESLLVSINSSSWLKDWKNRCNRTRKEKRNETDNAIFIRWSLSTHVHTDTHKNRTQSNARNSPSVT